MNNNVAIIGQIVENLSDSDLSYDDRQIVYEVMIEVFEDFNITNLEELTEIDSAFEDIWYKKYPQILEEEE